MSRSDIVDVWSHAFARLSRISLFDVVYRLNRTRVDARTVEIWVAGHTILAVAAVYAAVTMPGAMGVPILLGYGIARIFEVTVYQTNVLLFSEYRAKKAKTPYAIHGYRRMVLLLLHNYAEIICWFAAFYVYLGAHFSFKLPGTARTVTGAVYSSFIVMTTFGEPNIVPSTQGAVVVLLTQSALGLFMTILSIARFIGLIPPPKTLDPLEGTTRPTRMPRVRVERPGGRSNRSCGYAELHRKCAAT